ncbi:hypothetical protein P0136_09305 [Lentisphaerota bacterium ZTH]|nr:hypothetical protein JYG24_13185 [Lentisphaerota bacterium]WET05560.1 hypothetical protein P0136_09305 [Lentisphaerota bacterium ZTH]
MPTSVATLGSMTVTGDSVIGTCIKIIRRGLPGATLASPVAGISCNGVVAVTTAINKVRSGLPVANIGSIVIGVSSVGIPVTTTIGISCALTIIR